MEYYKLYNDKITLSFDEKKHIYSVNGKVVYGTTSIVGVLDKPALIYWAVNQAIENLQANLTPGKALDEVQIKTLLENARKAHRQRKDKSADLGTMIHKWLEDYIKARIEKKPVPKRPINREMKNAIDGFFKWAKKNNVKLIGCEQKIYSKKYKYAGTYDLDAVVNGKRTIIDFKTGKAIYPEHFLQASAYLQAREEEIGKKYNGGVAILRLSKENKEKEILSFEVQQVDRKQVDKLIKVFRCCLGIYVWKRDLKRQEILANNK